MEATMFNTIEWKRMLQWIRNGHKNGVPAINAILVAKGARRAFLIEAGDYTKSQFAYLTKILTKAMSPFARRICTSNNIYIIFVSKSYPGKALTETQISGIKESYNDIIGQALGYFTPFTDASRKRANTFGKYGFGMAISIGKHDFNTFKQIVDTKYIDSVKVKAERVSKRFSKALSFLQAVVRPVFEFMPSVIFIIDTVAKGWAGREDAYNIINDIMQIYNYNYTHYKMVNKFKATKDKTEVMALYKKYGNAIHAMVVQQNSNIVYFDPTTVSGVKDYKHYSKRMRELEDILMETCRPLA